MRSLYRIVLLLLVLPALNALAESHGPIFQLQVGAAVPYDIVEFAYTPGINLGLGVGGRLSDRFALIATLDASAFLVDREKVSAKNDDVWDGLRTNLDYTGKIGTAVFGGSAHLRYEFNPDSYAASVYLIGGPSVLYLLRQKMTISGTKGSRVLPERSETSLGFSGGVGLEIPIYRNSIALTVEARFSAAVTGGQASGLMPYLMLYRVGLNF